MATDLENLQTIKANIIAQIVEITASPKPTYSKGDQSVSWTQHLKELRDALEAINKQIEYEGGSNDIGIGETVEYTP